MSTTPNLAFPYLAAGQAQKHVTVNESLRKLDALLLLTLQSRTMTTPPSSPAEGVRYLVPANPTTAWAGKTGFIAAWQDGGWVFYAPQEGWLAWLADEDQLLAYNGVAWVLPPAAPPHFTELGVNTSADSTNRFAVSAAASLLTHAGAGHQLKLNKATLNETVSILFQTDWSGRAEIGTNGSDALSFKVSADGNNWQTGLYLASDGSIGINGITNPSVALHINGAARLGSSTVANLPNPTSAGAGALFFISNESGGAVLAFSDGTHWRRVTDRAIVS